jgi:hypothetical protein
MPLQTTPFPIIFIVIFLVLPIIILFGVIAEIFWFFWRFRNRPKLIITGVAILLLFGLGMSCLFVGASTYKTFYLTTTSCDQYKLVGFDGSGKTFTLRFPRIFGSGQSEFGAGPTIKTVDQDGNWLSRYPAIICDEILGTTANFDTDGLRRIKIIRLNLDSTLLD